MNTKTKTFGQILIENKIVTRNKLNTALLEQKEQPDKFLGQILIDMGVPQAVINKTLDSYRKRKPVGQIFVDLNYINNKQLKNALEKQKTFQKPLACTLLELGYITYDAYLNALSRHFNMSVMPLDSFTPTVSLQKTIGTQFALIHKIIVMENTVQDIKIAISEPSNDLINELYTFLPRSKNIDFYLAKPDEVEFHLKNIYSSKSKIEYKNKEKHEDKSEEKVPDAVDSPIQWEDVSSDESDAGHETETSALAVQYVNLIIINAYKMRSSDIHIEPRGPGRTANIRMRVDGVCQKVMEIPAKDVNAVISRIKIISGMNIADKRKPQDGKAKVRFKTKTLELRMASMPTVNGESMVIRMLASSGVLPLKKLNLSKSNEKETKRLIKKPHGIFLVVGPTGSGKTTTLHAILAEINTPELKIWTAEDPVEITQSGLQQVQVNHGIGLDFAMVMRSFLRLDPDVILIGEMRDFETANIAVESSLTGHLVFSTLHTNSAPETITRLFDMGIEPFNFSDAFLGILAQRLVRTLCPNCKKAYLPSNKDYERLVKSYGPEYFQELRLKKENITLYRPVGCKKCSNTGYRGRTGIHELLVASEEVRRVISQKGSIEDIRKQAVKQGMRTLIQDGVKKIIKGDTDFVQLHKVATV
ncbi:General secretion pathway protein E [Candidatus Magnetomoraceae bacterium gMMP-15]